MTEVTKQEQQQLYEDVLVSPPHLEKSQDLISFPYVGIKTQVYKFWDYFWICKLSLGPLYKFSAYLVILTKEDLFSFLVIPARY